MQNSARRFPAPVSPLPTAATRPQRCPCVTAPPPCPRVRGVPCLSVTPICEFICRSYTYFQHPHFLAAFRPLSKMLNATRTSRDFLGTFLGTHSAKKEIPHDEHMLNSSVRLLESFNSSLLALYTAKLLNQNIPWQKSIFSPKPSVSRLHLPFQRSLQKPKRGLFEGPVPRR